MNDMCKVLKTGLGKIWEVLKRCIIIVYTWYIVYTWFRELDDYNSAFWKLLLTRAGSRMYKWMLVKEWCCMLCLSGLPGHLKRVFWICFSENVAQCRQRAQSSLRSSSSPKRLCLSISWLEPLVETRVPYLPFTDRWVEPGNLSPSPSVHVPIMGGNGWCQESGHLASWVKLSSQTPGGSLPCGTRQAQREDGLYEKDIF